MLSGLLACSAGGSDASAQERPETGSGPARRSPRAEASLGVSDIGIWSDLDERIALPAPVIEGEGMAVLDAKRSLLVIYAGRGLTAQPLKVYPVVAASRHQLRIGKETIGLRAGDRTELAGLARQLRLSKHTSDKRVIGGDADGDGIPDILDLRIGARKTVLNAATYGAGYIRLGYPNGDVPREVGVCSDVIIRAVRNAGIDLQAALQNDIRAAKRSYPMVKRRNSHIDHRRVKTLLPYFKRHWNERRTELNDAVDPLMPGDVVFMDTFPSRPGPDHIGIISEKRGASGHPLVVNNWTDGSVTAELDLLDWVPVTHRFRMK